jgi:hypothetical protein
VAPDIVSTTESTTVRLQLALPSLRRHPARRRPDGAAMRNLIIPFEDVYEIGVVIGDGQGVRFSRVTARLRIVKTT